MSTSPSQEQVAEALKQIVIRHWVTDDEQYDVNMFADPDVSVSDGTITLRAFGLEASAADFDSTVHAFLDRLNEAVGEHDSPGPLFDTFISWLRANAEPIPADVLAQERAEREAYESTKHKIAPIAPDEIAAASATGVPLLVDFWAEWCAPCRLIAPVLAELSDVYAGRLAVRKLDVEAFEGVWETFGFRGIPTMILFQDGKELARLTGFGGRDPIVTMLEPHLPR